MPVVTRPLLSAYMYGVNPSYFVEKEGKMSMTDCLSPEMADDTPELTFEKNDESGALPMPVAPANPMAASVLGPGDAVGCEATRRLELFDGRDARGSELAVERERWRSRAERVELRLDVGNARVDGPSEARGRLT